MRKIVCVLVFLSLMLSCVSCSIPGKKPESGFWYCEELRIGIDFTLLNAYIHPSGKYYHEDGTVQDIVVLIDYGMGITFASTPDREDREQGFYYGDEFFHGEFKYDKRNNQFRVTSRPDNTVYIFKEQDEKMNTDS